MLNALHPFAAGLLTLLSWGDQGYADELVRGALSTLFIAILAYGLGLLLGFGAALCRLSSIPALKAGAWAYATLFRAVPELILILLLYYAGGEAINFALAALGAPAVVVNGTAAVVVVLGVVQGAYACEVIRSGIMAVPRGYIEAALSLGFSPSQTFRRITLPLMLPLALPGLANIWLGLTKATALVSIVGFTELTLATTQAAGSSKAYFVFYGLAMLLYFWLSTASTQLFVRLELHLQHGRLLADPEAG